MSITPVVGGRVFLSRSYYLFEKPVWLFYIEETHGQYHAESSITMIFPFFVPSSSPPSILRTAKTRTAGMLWAFRRHHHHHHHLLVLVLFLSNLFGLFPPVSGQRPTQCFEEDFLRRCHEMDPPAGVTPPNHLELEPACHSIFIDYFDRNEELVQNPEERVARMGSIPANSELCATLTRFLPYCYWCVQEEACFVKEDYILSCDLITTATTTTNDTNVAVVEDPVRPQDYCVDLEEWLSGVEWELDLHYERLANKMDIHGSPEECEGLRRSYPQCYWCKPNASPGYCSVGMLCGADSDKNGELGAAGGASHVELDVVQIEETCAELDQLADVGDWPLTWEFCDRAALAIPTGCVEQHCEPCFDPDELSCNAPLLSGVADNLPADHHNGEEFLDEVTVARLCAEIWWFVRQDPGNLTYHETALTGLRASNPQCQDFHRVYHLCFWCNPHNASYACAESQSCTFGEAASIDNVADDPSFREEFQDGAVCDDLRPLADAGLFPSTARFCAKAEKFAAYCSCANPELAPKYDYIGADTQSKKLALVWMSRVAALLSFMGGSYILWDSLAHAEKRRTVYHQLLVGISIFDICTALAWSFATAPIPTDVEGGGYNIVGARGNEATCEAQAFFIQLGVTSIFYNVSLAVYYVLVIVYGKREHYLRSVRLYLHALPVVVGCGLACCGLTRYGWLEYGCHILPGPDGNLVDVLVFVVVPIGLSIILITFAMLMVYLRVRSKSRASRRWRLGIGSSAALENQVFWQALFYTLSFYMTWPIIFCVYAGSLDTRSSRYSFSILVAFAAPLQGFNNFLVYIRSQLLTQRLGQSRTSSFTTKSLMDMGTTCFSCLYRKRQNNDMADERQPEDCGNSDPENAPKLYESPRQQLRFQDPSVVIAFEGESTASMRQPEQDNGSSEPGNAAKAAEGPHQELQFQDPAVVTAMEEESATERGQEDGSRMVIDTEASFDEDTSVIST